MVAEFQTLDLSEADLNSMLDDHPIVSKGYTVLTPMIVAAYSYIRDRVWMRKTGLYLYAPPRTGKTTCRNAVRLFLRDEFPDFHLVSFTAGDGRSASRSKLELLTDILNSEGIIVPKRAQFKDLLFDLLVHIEMKLSGQRSKHVVFMIDEMHRLSDDDFSTLLTVHNRLDDKKIQMTTIGFASPEISHVQTTLKGARKQQLLSRFLVEPIPFDGCGLKEDLMAVLRGYDMDNRFPEGSDWPYTRFFLPDLYDAGFRLSDYCDEIWSALQKAIEPFGGSTIPMLHLTSTVEFLLAANRTPRGGFFLLDTKTIDRAVLASGLANYYDTIS